jgi:Ca-activated chloride channel family protein
MMVGDTDFYARLGIERNASEEDIRRAYRDAARKLHPDVNVEEGATELFINIKEAYEVLVDPQKREAYDEDKPPPEPPPIRLKTEYSRPALNRIDDPQLIYALVELDVFVDVSDEEDSTAPINLTLVLDGSTSMKGERLDRLKNTAIELIRQLRPQDVISVVFFNDRAEVVIPAGTKPVPQKVETNIRMIQAQGGTEMFTGLQTGFQEVRRHLNSKYANHIILITDGHTYGDEDACLKLADQAANIGITISALGIGSEWNDEFLEELVQRTGGNCLFVSRPKDIESLLKEKFQGLGKTYVERVSLNFHTIPGVKLNYAFRLNPELGALPISPPIQLGGIPYKSRQRILLEFLVDPIRSDISRLMLAEGHFSFDIPKYAMSKYRLPITLMRPVSTAYEMEPPPHTIVEAMSKLTLYRMQENVRQNVVAGDLESAAQSLQNIATHLLSQGENDLAKTALLEVQNVRQQQRLSQEGEKEIKYGTRSLLLPSGYEYEEG